MFAQRRDGWWRRAAVAAALGLWVVPCATARGADEGARTDVLNDGTLWRFHVTYRPIKGPGIDPAATSPHRWVRWGEQLDGPLPPDDWAQPDFDDAGWPRRRGPFLEGYGDARYPGAALLCVRGKFGVADPAKVKDLELALVYRGGAVVYVNGREAGRGHMPPGHLTPLTPAEAYPRTVFVTPDGSATLPNYGSRMPPDDVRDRYEGRIRRTTIRIPSGALRPGTNVLALELHRPPTPDDLPGGRGLTWDTVGLNAARLTCGAGSAVRPNIKPPDAAHVWVAPSLLRPGIDADCGDPFEGPGTIQLAAPVNGFASGQVVVSGPGERRGVSARVTDLESAGGARIASRETCVRYARPYGDRGFIALDPSAPEAATMQAIWVSVKVPADARPGRYAGRLEVAGLEKPVAVPVELVVYGWTVGDPKDWRTCVNLLESPESVAGHYQVPLWSDEHFGLMRESLRLMGEAGNDVLGLSAVGKTVFGDDPMIVFRRDGDRWVPELEFAERYLALYNDVAGEPKFLSVHVWSYGMYQRGAGRDGGKAEKRAETIPIVELQGNRLVPAEMPMYGEPGTREVWQQVMDGLSAIVRQIGWTNVRLLLGTSGDGWPHPDTIGLFRQTAPYARWRAITHGSGVPKWGPTDADRTQPNGMVVGYCEFVRRITNTRSGNPDAPVTCNSRDCVGTDPFGYRSLAVQNVGSAHFDGFCWKGLDYWPYTAADGKTRSALNTYVHFGNIVGSTPRTMAAPGPRGAIPTVQYEMLREGIQDAEALWLIRDALQKSEARQRLGDDLAARAKATLTGLLCMLETGHRVSPGGGQDVDRWVRRLYETAAEVTRAVGSGR